MYSIYKAWEHVTCESARKTTCRAEKLYQFTCDTYVNTYVYIHNCLYISIFVAMYTTLVSRWAQKILYTFAEFINCYAQVYLDIAM